MMRDAYYVSRRAAIALSFRGIEESFAYAGERFLTLSGFGMTMLKFTRVAQILRTNRVFPHLATLPPATLPPATLRFYRKNLTVPLQAPSYHKC